MFPKIDGPCPYLDRFDAIMDGDQCRMCERQVFDLTAMDDSARAAFLRGCAGESVCVSYRFPARPALAAALAAAAIAMPVSAAAQEAPAVAAAEGEEIIITAGRVGPSWHREPITVSEPVRELRARDLKQQPKAPRQRIRRKV
ncbi:MAG: hypothetical protein V4574_00230 [Pseudomonadota bacterium]